MGLAEFHVWMDVEVEREEKVAFFLEMGHIEQWEDVLHSPGRLIDLYSYSQKKDLPFHEWAQIRVTFAYWDV